MASTKDRGNRYVFLDYLRVVAAWLVVWDHLAVIGPLNQHILFGPAGWVREHITRPLQIIQDFGWFGVAVFFLISGFIISDRARVESAYSFIVRRLLRIYPVLAVAVFLSIALGTAPQHLGVRDIVLNLALANYVSWPLVVIVTVAWTLAIEVIFYALTAATQAAKGSPHRIAFNLAVVAFIIWKRAAFGPDFKLFAFAAGYIPILVMGQTLYWWLERKRLSAPMGLAYLAASAAIFQWYVKAMRPEFFPFSNSYLVSVIYAVLLFVALRRVRLPELRVVRFLSDSSYSVYLMHAIIGAQVLGFLMTRIPLGWAILSGAAASLAAAWASHLLIEKPTQKLARDLTSGRSAWGSLRAAARSRAGGSGRQATDAGHLGSRSV
jgi:peptidoglycan/LPS O-acetylase OafA/YrhL